MARRRESAKSADADGAGVSHARRERFAALEAHDRRWREAGYARVAGVDEAGRGALAGPVTAAAVVLPPGCDLVGVDDSKRLREAERERLFDRIVACALAVGVAFVDAEAIDRGDILRATLRAMHRAVEALRPVPDLVLVDGRDAITAGVPAVAIPHGDATSLAIAAASIVAKVARDRAMRRLARRFDGYGLERNKGYGTREHVAAIVARGASPVHRRSFLSKVVEKNPTMF